MRQLKHFAFIGALIGATVARADAAHGRHWPDVVSTARAIESSTDITLLPTSDGGRITVNYCSGCVSTTLSTDSSTVYLIGSTKATLAQLRSYLADGRTHPMTVIASLKDQVALSVKVPAAAGVRPSPR